MLLIFSVPSGTRLCLVRDSGTRGQEDGKSFLDTKLFVWKKVSGATAFTYD